MALIRHIESSAGQREVVRLNLGDLARQGDAILAAARSEAQKIVEGARAERERIIAGAREQGFAEGKSKGHAEGRAAGQVEGRQAALAQTQVQLATLEQGLMKALQAFEAERDRLLLEGKEDVLRLAVGMGERVAKRAIQFAPESVVEQVAATLAMVLRPSRLVLSIHPDDAPLVREAMPSLTQRYAAAQHVELKEDAALSRGSAIARLAGGGTIDASIETQIARIVEAVLPAPAQGDAGAQEGGA